MAFTPRLNAPSYSDPDFYSQNPFYQSGYGLPNCTCYAWGRFKEILGSNPNLSRSNAENWWGHKDGYERGQTPRLGAVGCWRKGKAGVSGDGAGHVMVVEQINGNKVVFSSSAWKGTRFFTRTFTIGSYNYSGLVFQGFIYNPAVPATASTPSSSATYVVGKTYTLQANMKVRTGASTKYRWKKKSELTKNGQANAQNQTYAVLKKGTRVTCQQVIKSGSDIWIKIPSGYVCAKLGNAIYVK